MSEEREAWDHLQPLLCQQSPKFLRFLNVSLSRNKHACQRNLVHVHRCMPACHKCCPSHAVQRLISAEASLTRKHDTQTHTGAASQTTVSLLTGPESAGMYLQTFPLGLKCSFYYFISLDSADANTPIKENTHLQWQFLVSFELVASPKFSHDGSLGEPAKTKSLQSKIPSVEQQKFKIL